MAKLTGPLHSLTASGSIGHSLTLLHSAGRNIAKKKSAPGGKPSAAQLTRRTLYQACAAGWSLLSPAQKATWTAPAKAANITPFNAYMAAALRAGGPIDVTVWDAGTTTWDAGTTTWI